jgi:hypothetical protein
MGSRMGMRQDIFGQIHGKCTMTSYAVRTMSTLPRYNPRP